MIIDTLWDDIFKKYNPINFATPRHEWEKLTESVINNAVGGITVIDYSTDPLVSSKEFMLDLSNKLKEDNIKLIVLTGDISDMWSNDDVFVYFPYWFMSQKGEVNYQPYNAKKFRFSFLSSRPSFHRVYFYDCVKHAITDDDCFSVRGEHVDEWEYSLMGEYVGSIDRSIEESLPYISKSATEYDSKNDFGDFPNDHSNQHPAYNSFFNIIGETSMCEAYTSEKLWKTIRSGVLPIVFEHQGLNDGLEKLGFIMHNTINKPIQTFVEQIKHVRVCMENLTYDEVNDIALLHKDTTNHNMELFHSGTLEKIFKDYIKDKLDL